MVNTKFNDQTLSHIYINENKVYFRFFLLFKTLNGFVFKVFKQYSTVVQLLLGFDDAIF